MRPWHLLAPFHGRVTFQTRRVSSTALMDPSAGSLLALEGVLSPAPWCSYGAGSRRHALFAGGTTAISPPTDVWLPDGSLDDHKFGFGVLRWCRADSIPHQTGVPAPDEGRVPYLILQVTGGCWLLGQIRLLRDLPSHFLKELLL